MQTSNILLPSAINKRVLIVEQTMLYQQDKVRNAEFTSYIVFLWKNGYNSTCSKRRKWKAMNQKEKKKKKQRIKAGYIIKLSTRVELACGPQSLWSQILYNRIFLTLWRTKLEKKRIEQALLIFYFFAFPSFKFPFCKGVKVFFKNHIV